MSSPILIHPDIAMARSLDELCAALRASPVPVPDEVMTHLPTFGGAEPSGTSGVWSWDETRLLVGTCAADLKLVPRAS